jgi:hypothetical protein
VMSYQFDAGGAGALKVAKCALRTCQ